MKVILPVVAGACALAIGIELGKHFERQREKPVTTIEATIEQETVDALGRRTAAYILAGLQMEGICVNKLPTVKGAKR